MLIHSYIQIGIYIMLFYNHRHNHNAVIQPLVTCIKCRENVLTAEHTPLSIFRHFLTVKPDIYVKTLQ